MVSRAVSTDLTKTKKGGCGASLVWLRPLRLFEFQRLLRQRDFDGADV